MKGLSLKLLGRREEAGTYNSYFDVFCVQASILPTVRVLQALQSPHQVDKTRLDAVIFTSSAPNVVNRGSWDFKTWEWKVMIEALGLEKGLDAGTFKAFMKCALVPRGTYASMEQGFYGSTALRRLEGVRVWG